MAIYSIRRFSQEIKERNYATVINEAQIRRFMKRGLDRQGAIDLIKGRDALVSQARTMRTAGQEAAAKAFSPEMRAAEYDYGALRKSDSLGFFKKKREIQNAAEEASKKRITNKFEQAIKDRPEQIDPNIMSEYTRITHRGSSLYDEAGKRMYEIKDPNALQKVERKGVNPWLVGSGVVGAAGLGAAGVYAATQDKK